MQERKNGSAVAHGSNSATFEQQFARLQEVVQRLSDGNLTLQEALSSFEEGMSLADSCSRMLEEAELRVQQVSNRATQSGLIAAAELDTAMRAQPVEEASGGLLMFEIETYETTVVFDEPRPIGKDTQAKATKAQTKETPPQPQRPTPGPLPLDPLFDEDD